MESGKTLPSCSNARLEEDWLVSEEMLASLKEDLRLTKLALEEQVRRGNLLEERMAKLEQAVVGSSQQSNSDICSYPVNTNMIGNEKNLMTSYIALCEEMYRNSRLRVGDIFCFL
jgi:hypothetical protein